MDAGRGGRMTSLPHGRELWEQQVELLRGAKRTPWRDARYRLSRNKLALAGSVIALLFVLAAIFGPLAAPYDPAAQDLLSAREAPGAAGHLLGTDSLGRDQLSRLLQGIRISMEVGLLTTLVALL